jgi:hypothetical protein
VSSPGAADRHARQATGCPILAPELPGRPGLRFHAGVQAQRFADLLTFGWVRLAGHLDTDECAALAKPQTVPWTQMTPKVGTATQHGWFAQLPFPEAPPPVQALGSLMRATVSAALGQQLPDWSEATWQHYEPDYGHIDPHRDQAYYKGIILIVTLSGQAEFTVLESRNPPVTLDRWTTGGGDMVLLRGADLGAAGARCPLHSVGTPTSDRLTMTLRHNERGYNPWTTP